MAGYIAVGHGLRSTGVFDPGALDGLIREHDAATRVAAVISEAFARASEPVVTEVHGPGEPEDPNWAGSVARINRLGVVYAVEVHFDWSGAPPGAFGLYVSQAGLAMAEHVRNVYRFFGHAVRDNQRRPDLGFLTGTNCPALIWECGPVHEVTDDEAIMVGETIACGLLQWVGANVNPTIVYVPRPSTEPLPDPDPLIEQLRRQLAACEQSKLDVTAALDAVNNSLGRAKALAAQIMTT